MQSTTQVQLRLFADRLPYKPYAANELSLGLQVLPKPLARTKRYVQYDPPAWRGWLIFDVDRTYAATAWIDPALPPPTWIAQNPHNSHAHIAYALETPVIRTEAGRLAPLRLASAIDNAYRIALKADFGYACLVCKNPEHAGWRVTFPGGVLYELNELAEYVDLSAYKRHVPEYGLGRNCLLFDRLRNWAYVHVREYWPLGFGPWYTAVYEKTLGYNDFAEPLPYSEVKATAKSVARWVWQRFTPAQFQAVQSARGRRSGQARRRGSDAETQPWTKLGISRRAYYYRKSRHKLSCTRTISDNSPSPGRKKSSKRKAELLPEVLKLKANGMTQKSIAKRLNISVNTITNWLRSRENHKSHIRYQPLR